MIKHRDCRALTFSCCVLLIVRVKLAVFLGRILDELFGKLLALFSFLFWWCFVVCVFFFSFLLLASVQCMYSFLQLLFQRALSFIMP